MIAQLGGWLAQPLTIPLWAFIVALILPVAYFARLAKDTIDQRFGISDTTKER